MESTWGIDEPVSEELTCSDEGSLSEPPPSLPSRPKRRAPTAKVGRPNLRTSPKTSAGGRGGGVGRRNMTRSLSLRKPPLPPMGEIHPLSRAPKGGLLSLPLLGQGGHQLALRLSACPRP